MNERVDAKSQELIEEFFKHRDECLTNNPDMDANDTARIFEGWVIQKIAGPQVAVLELAECLKAKE